MIDFLLQPKHFENPRLFCDFFTNGNPGLLLQPIKRELISLHPYVVLYHSFVTRAEAKSIRELSVPGVSAFMWKHTLLYMQWVFYQDVEVICLKLNKASLIMQHAVFDIK